MLKTCMIDSVIGSRLSIRRIAAGLDKAALADRIGVTEQRLAAFEAGEARIDPRSMLTLCRVLDLQVGYFFEPWTGAAEPAEPVRLLAAE